MNKKIRSCREIRTILCTKLITKLFFYVFLTKLIIYNMLCLQVIEFKLNK